MKNTTICLLSMLGGVAIGSAVTFAFATKSGCEMRSLVRDFLNEEIDKWRASFAAPTEQPKVEPK